MDTDPSIPGFAHLDQQKGDCESELGAGLSELGVSPRSVDSGRAMSHKRDLGIAAALDGLKSDKSP